MYGFLPFPSRKRMIPLHISRGIIPCTVIYYTSCARDCQVIFAAQGPRPRLELRTFSGILCPKFEIGFPAAPPPRAFRSRCDKAAHKANSFFRRITIRHTFCLHRPKLFLVCCIFKFVTFCRTKFLRGNCIFSRGAECGHIPRYGWSRYPDSPCSSRTNSAHESALRRRTHRPAPPPPFPRAKARWQTLRP